MRKYPHVPRNKQVAAAFGEIFIVCPFVQNGAVGGAVVFCPLVFNMDQRPLSAAEFEMLQAGEPEEALLRIDHPIRMQVTPAGKAASSTVTV